MFKFSSLSPYMLFFFFILEFGIEWIHFAARCRNIILYSLFCIGCRVTLTARQWTADTDGRTLRVCLAELSVGLF